MTEPRGRFPVAALLSFNGGFVDTVGFLGLSGLFVAHVTGNFVTLGAALVLGSHGILNKILALPEFITVIALARLLGGVARRRGWPVLRDRLLVSRHPRGRRRGSRRHAPRRDTAADLENPAAQVVSNSCKYSEPVPKDRVCVQWNLRPCAQRAAGRFASVAGDRRVPVVSPCRRLAAASGMVSVQAGAFPGPGTKQRRS